MNTSDNQILQKAERLVKSRLCLCAYCGHPNQLRLHYTGLVSSILKDVAGAIKFSGWSYD